MKTASKALFLCCLASASLLLSGCPEDPMGPDNRMALIAFGRCDHQQALELTNRAIERGEDPHHIQRAWMLKAAILRDQGQMAALKTIYPQLDAAWKNARKSELSDSRRERDINILIDVAHNERRANRLAVDCDRPLQDAPTR
ncbi:hypothetical protein [Thiorhodovibrio winogradskyi]|nr:hypothetical protein [Thiorhodovibrio winogradskyi]